MNSDWTWKHPVFNKSKQDWSHRVCNYLLWLFLDLGQSWTACDLRCVWHWVCKLSVYIFIEVKRYSFLCIIGWFAWSKALLTQGLLFHLYRTGTGSQAMSLYIFFTFFFGGVIMATLSKSGLRRNPEITILNAWKNSCVSSLVHEGPAWPLVPRANFGWSTPVGYGVSSWVIPGKAGRVEVRIRTWFPPLVVAVTLVGTTVARDQGRSPLYVGSVPWVLLVWACFVKIDFDKTRH